MLLIVVQEDHIGVRVVDPCEMVKKTSTPTNFSIDRSRACVGNQQNIVSVSRHGTQSKREEEFNCEVVPTKTHARSPRYLGTLLWEESDAQRDVFQETNRLCLFLEVEDRPPIDVLVVVVVLLTRSYRLLTYSWTRKHRDDEPSEDR